MKNKILILLLLLGGVFSFAFTSLHAQTEFVDDNTFVVSNLDYEINELDIKKFMLFLLDYAETYDLFSEVDGFLVADIYSNLSLPLKIDFQSDLPGQSSAYNVTFMYDKSNDIYSLTMLDYQDQYVINFLWLNSSNEFNIQEMATYPFTIVFSGIEIQKVPPFTGLINFISDFLKDILKSITDMTMSLINNIWDTNLIDINFVILSDTPIFSGTLNDMLYSVFSIFYVIFAITFVWRLLKKLLRKLFSMVRW